MRSLSVFLPTFIAAVSSLLICGGTALADAAARRPDPAETASAVDVLLASETETAATAEAAAIADDPTFLRRVFLDLIGAPPTPEDILAFTLSDDPDKRGSIVDRLLADKAFGENVARYWRDVILYRRTDERALVSAVALERFLSDEVNANTPWSDIATAFITAEGDVRERGETALIMAQSGRPEDVSAEVSRIFLGIQIQCAQCHDHKTDRWRREQFHQLAAFFPRVATRPDRSSTPPTFLVTVNDRPFEVRRQNANNRYVGSPEHYMPNLLEPTARGERMQPVFFVSGAKLPFGTRDAERRTRLAEWITAPDNPWFAKALVNRLWAELVGEGFYEPVDDMGPDRDCAAPQTLDRLAADFAASGYDTKWLYRTITATSAYQRESRSRRGYNEPAFQANCPQPLRGDQLFDALTAALDLNVSTANRFGNSPYAQRNSPRVRFNAAFGFDPSDPREEIGGSIQQALALMNSPLINQAINARRPDGLGQLLRANPADRDALVELYLLALSRGPSDTEVRTCLAYIQQVGDRGEAFEDILWALVNSTEFRHRQ